MCIFVQNFHDMKKSLLFLFALLPMIAMAQFDQYFTESSLRVDYCLTGNDKATTFSLKELIHEPYWSGSKTNLIDNLEFGNYIVKVYEAGTDSRERINCCFPKATKTFTASGKPPTRPKSSPRPLTNPSLCPSPR